MTYPVEGPTRSQTRGEVGFYFRSYPLFRPAARPPSMCSGKRISTIHLAGTAALCASDNTTRVLWLLDSGWDLPGIITATERSGTGKLRELAVHPTPAFVAAESADPQHTLVSTTRNIERRVPDRQHVVENCVGLTRARTRHADRDVPMPLAPARTTTNGERLSLE